MREQLVINDADMALRQERIIALAERVFGDPEKAHHWLSKPKRALGGATPLAHVASKPDAGVVEQMLYRIEQVCLPESRGAYSASIPSGG